MMLVLLGLGFGFVHRVVNTAEIPGAIVSLSDPQTAGGKKNELSRQGGQNQTAVANRIALNLFEDAL